MQSKIKIMKIALIVQIVIGLVVTGYMVMFLGVMSTDAPTSSYKDVLMGVSIALGLIGLPTVLLPLLSLREIGRFEETKKLHFTYTNAIIGLLIGVFANPIFLLIAIWQFYIIYGLTKAEAIANFESKDDNTNA